MANASPPVGADPTNAAVPTASQAVAGVPATQTAVIPGTSIPAPVSLAGIETLTSVAPPFRSNAPKWFTPPDANGNQSIWSKLGCAVPEPGRYIQTSNVLIGAMVQLIGRELFHVAWHYNDRLLDRWPSRKCLWDINQLLTIGRNRLTAVTTPDNADPLQPTHSNPSYQMFVCYPIPLFGQLGTPNTWLYECFSTLMLLQTEAMQHADNVDSYKVSQDFFNACYPYIKYLIVDMAVKFFGAAPADAKSDTYVIPSTAWAAYNPSANGVSTEGTATRPPIGDMPTDLDLEPIRGLPYSTVIPFLQPWPDSRLLYSSGGIWANPSAPASVGTQPGSPGTQPASGGKGGPAPGGKTAPAPSAPAQLNPAPLLRTGPPNAPTVPTASS